MPPSTDELTYRILERALTVHGGEEWPATLRELASAIASDSTRLIDVLQLMAQEGLLDIRKFPRVGNMVVAPRAFDPSGDRAVVVDFFTRGDFRIRATATGRQRFDSENAKHATAATAPAPATPVKPDVSFMANDTLRRIVERDCVEAQKCLAVGALKAAIIMSGSAIEALLLDRLLANETLARVQPKAPNEPFSKWHLAHMIDVAASCGWLAKHAQSFSHSVRDYRNLVHPDKERTEPLKIGQPEAMIAVNLLLTLVRDFR